MSTIVISSARAGGLPQESGYTHGFGLLTVAAIAAAAAAMLVPSTVRRLSRAELAEAMPHPELGMLAAGTLVGDESE
jgi:hypothetical protein